MKRGKLRLCGDGVEICIYGEGVEQVEPDKYVVTIDRSNRAVIEITRLSIYGDKTITILVHSGI